MQRLYSLAISVLTLAALPAFLALGDTTKPVTTAKKKPTNVTAAKRAKAAPPTSAASRARAKTSTAAQSTTGRATTRKVVVTRKKVNGKWVRSSRIVKVPATNFIPIMIATSRSNKPLPPRASLKVRQTASGATIQWMP